jgi:hypothetical protein
MNFKSKTLFLTNKSFFTTASGRTAHATVINTTNDLVQQSIKHYFIFITYCLCHGDLVDGLMAQTLSILQIGAVDT